MRRNTALLLAIGALAGAPALSRAEGAPLPPPTADQVKACVQQMDLSKQWTFDWKTIDVGQARHPRNPLERVGLAAADADFGYPVHVVYVFNHATTIDAQYWMTHDARGRWWIVPLCRP
jgi:hypothetical protein